LQTEVRKADLETNLTTNLWRRKQELEAVILSTSVDSLVADSVLKGHELSDVKTLVDDVSGQLKSKKINHHCLLCMS
jgi:structural maintenance of chromosome 3 (chondroitin sulfate proteoglycan 6)